MLTANKPITDNVVGATIDTQPALGVRAERVQMLRELAHRMSREAEQVADRLFGVEPQAGCEATPDPTGAIFGSFAQLDLCLDELETQMCEAERQLSRISGV